MNLILLISRRFLKSKKKNSPFSLMTFMSILGVMLGVMIPIIVLSILVGFQDEIKSKILGVKGHLIITKDDNTYIQDYYDFIKNLKEKNPEIVSAVPFIEVQGIVQFYNSFEPIVVRGIDEKIFDEDKEFDALFRLKKGKQKELEKNYQVLIGEKLANNYFINLKDRLKLFLVEQDSLNLNIQPRSVTTSVEGTFETGFQDFDLGVIYISLKTLQKQFNRENQVSSIDIKLTNIWEVEKIKRKLIDQFGDQYSFYTWQEINFNFFKALSLEKAIMYLIMSLILLVAIFNVMSCQLIMIVERKREIGILKTLGMKTKQILQVFMIQGFVLSFTGSLIGGILGYWLSLKVEILVKGIEFIINIFNTMIYFIKGIFIQNLEYVPFEFFPQNVYYLNSIPSDPNVLRIIFFMFLAIILSLLCSFIPAYKATKLKPIEVMRYE